MGAEAHFPQVQRPRCKGRAPASSAFHPRYLLGPCMARGPSWLPGPVFWGALITFMGLPTRDLSSPPNTIALGLLIPVFELQGHNIQSIAVYPQISPSLHTHAHTHRHTLPTSIKDPHWDYPSCRYWTKSTTHDGQLQHGHRV